VEACSGNKGHQELLKGCLVSGLVGDPVLERVEKHAWGGARRSQRGARVVWGCSIRFGGLQELRTPRKSHTYFLHHFRTIPIGIADLQHSIVQALRPVQCSSVQPTTEGGCCTSGAPRAVHQTERTRSLVLLTRCPPPCAAPKCGLAAGGGGPPCGQLEGPQ
jgi:hypothetical protein